MNTKKIILLISSIVVIGAVSIWYFLGRNSILPKYIPSSVDVVFKINTLSVGRKIDFDEIKKLRSYKPLLDGMKEISEDSKIMSKIIENPSNLGISISQNIYFFAENAKSNLNKTVGCLVGISDPKKFNTMLDEFAKESDLISETVGEFKIYKSKTEEKHPELADSINNYIEDIEPEKQLIIAVNNEACLFYYAGENAEKGAKNIMSLKKENSLANNENYNEFEDQSGDFSIYVNYQSFIDKYYISLLPESLKKHINNTNAVSLNINFNDGNIEFTSKNYVKNVSLMNENMILKEEGLSDEQLELISPNGQILLGYMLNFNMPECIKILKTIPQYKSILGDINTQFGLSENEVETMFAGNLALTVNKLNSVQIESKEIDYENYDPETGNFKTTITNKEGTIPQFNLQLGIGNEKAFQKIMKKLQEMIPAQTFSSNGKNQFLIKTNSNFGNIHCVYVKNNLIMTNDQTSATILVKNQTWNNQLDKNVNTLFKENSNAFYLELDPKKYGTHKLSVLAEVEDDSKKFQQFLSYFSSFKNIEMHGNSKNASGMLNFASSEENSFMVMIKLADKIATEIRKTQKEDDLMRQDMMNQEGARAELLNNIDTVELE